MAAVLALTTALAMPAFAGQYVQQQGSETGFDIVTWNLLQFVDSDPYDSQKVGEAIQLIKDLDVDLIAAQEVTYSWAFNYVATQVDGWEAVFGTNWSGLRFGYWYNADKVELTNVKDALSSTEIYPRAPLQADVTMYEPSKANAQDTLSFKALNVHLKANRNDPDSRAHRDSSITRLRGYILNQWNTRGDSLWMVLGDWNDEVDDPYNYNVFLDVLDDERFVLLTASIDSAGNLATWYPNEEQYGSYYFYDHIMVTRPLYDKFAEATATGDTEVLTLDREWQSYEQFSDHRPVMASFPADVVNSVGGEPVQALPSEMALSIWPVPSNSGVSISYEAPGVGRARMEVVDLLGRTVMSRHVDGGRGRIAWGAVDIPSGVYFVRLSGGEAGVVTRRIVLVR